jgi:subtilase family serine protease
LAGKINFANESDPLLPKAFQRLVQSVQGLHNFTVRPQIRRSHPQFTSSKDAFHYLAPDDWAAPILSVSYGWCDPDETTTDFKSRTNLFQQATSQGMTIVASSGDAELLPVTNGIAVQPPSEDLPSMFQQAEAR